MNTVKETKLKKDLGIGKQRSYSEIVTWLDSNWKAKRTQKSLQVAQQLDKALGSPSQSINSILITGTNGKGLTIHFTTQLLQEEKINVGAFYSPHILTYNERIAINNESISNKFFTEIANEVINAAETLETTPHSIDVLTVMALVHFKNMDIDVALLETSENISFHPLNICTPKITAITRVTTNEVNVPHAEVEEHISKALEFVKADTYVVSGDQSKLNLQYIQKKVVELNGQWLMPTRKLAPLAYPFEQLHGRAAALAERVAQTYINNFVTKKADFVTNGLLVKPKGQRGRPTTEAKRQLEMNPRRTMEQFWGEAKSFLSGRFQLLEKEKPTILLDNASNLDAFQNLLLGIRLMHYQRPLKGLSLIVGCTNNDICNEEFLKLIRYFFKKTSGQLILCPLNEKVKGESETSWNVEEIINDVKGYKIKAKTADSFAKAFELAKKSVDERYGLIAITGSHGILKEYWTHKGIKKV